MIIVKLMGGLGNQMFQYAAARRLASHHDTGLKLDISFFEGNQQVYVRRKYELNHLNIHVEIATPREVAEITGHCENILQNFMMCFRQMAGMTMSYPSVYAERHFHFDPAVLAAPDNTYLDGYWQSEKYFNEIGETIRQEFTVRNPLEGRNLEMAESMRGTNSVSLHVRRGDYVTNPEAMKVHGVCGVDYFRRCMEELRDKVPDPHLFVFSDEPEWVREHVKIPFSTTFVSKNGPDKGYEDMRLMSLCGHNIIANSSFSWWGAWLNRNPNKMVFAPRTWLRDTSHDTADILPAAWLKL